MEKNTYKKSNAILIVTLLIGICCIPMISGNDVERSENLEVLVNNLDVETIELFAHLPEFEFSIACLGDEKFALLYLEDEGFSNVEGQAKLPKIRRMIEIPQGANPTITITSDIWESTSLDELDLPSRIIPVQPPVMKPESNENDIIIDDEYYNTDKYIPEEKVKILEIKEIRGRRLALIEIATVLYNPAKGDLQLMISCDVIIDLPGSNVEKTINSIERYSSPAFEEMYEHIFLNYGFYENMAQSSKDPEGFLIIVHDAFNDEITPLANWKTTMGYDTTVTLTSSIPGGVSADNIKDYIEDAYNNWTIPPSYILLVGDTPQIPAFTGSASGGETDTYFVTMDGDIFPDIFIGRFPADTETQVNTMVNKTIYYEQGDFPNISWIKKAAFIASSDHGQLGEETHNYVINTHLLPNNYTCDKIYQASGGNTQDIFDAVNDGRSLCIYSGHGGPTGWGCVPFDNTDVYSLTNQGMYPFVCSHACSTSTYEGSSETFSEAWVRAPNKGGIAMWGSSVSTYWDEDDVIERRVFDAWWNLSLDRIGQMTDKGMYDAYIQNPSLQIEKFIESYNVMGDASVKIWSEDPFVPEHDIAVENIDVDDVVAHGETQTVSATVRNVGNNTETSIVVDFKVNGSFINNATVAILDPMQSTIVSFDWNPDYGTYLVSIEAHPVPGENITDNNAVNKTVHVIPAPDIWLNETDLEFNVNAGETSNSTLTIGNEPGAEAPLNFSVAISYSGAKDSWLIVTPENGSIPVGETMDLNVQIDATGLTEGDYKGYIDIDSNDLDEPILTVVVNLSVVFADDVGVISVNSPVGQQVPGSYKVNVTVENFGSMDNTFQVNCSIYEGVNLTEDFEIDDGGYVAGGTGDWEWGIPTSGPGSAHSGSNCWATNLNGDHSDYANEWVDSILIDIPTGVPAQLSFWHWYNIEDGYSHWDGGNVKISTNGGSTWSILGSYLDPYPIEQCYSGNSGIPGEPCFSGSSGGWQYVTFDLSFYSGEQVMLRWHFGSDTSTNYGGWYIDDVSINVQGSSLILDETPVYVSTTTVSIDAYDTKYVEFTPAWDADEFGVFAINIETLLSGDEDIDNDRIVGVVEILSAPQGYVTTLVDGWNFVSLPFNQSLLKNNLIVNYNAFDYTWSDAAAAGYVNDYIFGWDRSGQTYTFADTLEPGYGYWVYSYEACQLNAPVFNVNFDGYITSLKENWNIVGLPNNIPENKSDILVNYDGIDYSWSDAVSSGIINDNIFGWNDVGQGYTFSDMFEPGYAYWMYTYYDCTLYCL